ncbi:MAG: bifunctional (p)ppGpp synthetase/guanosine-3',5'-bis(diphosphate) 3'-pyrophosphohydrolase [Clostridia bacterium]|nr:bifunctional (p)ppGpp synthetase/guanosine-3',5'-bis(diphosphate) 3'-pyrophosphohydrolase [Clostridia bacterium]
MSEPTFAPIADMLDLLATFGDRYDLEKIKRAYLLACRAHEGQFRQSGEPYVSHPIAVAQTVVELGLDTDSICAAFLHDTLEDCPDCVTPDILKEQFGEDVFLIVDGVTKILQIEVENREEQQIESIRKMMLATSKDIRVIIVKLCDRLHNMRTLGGKKNEDRQRSIAVETMRVYAPLAHRLGMQRIKLELENLALLYLDPVGYEEVTSAVDARFGRSRDVLVGARKAIEEKLRSSGISFTVTDRIKSVYSLYRKIYELGKPFEEIFDFYALRIIVNTVEECYTVLGMIHELFSSIPGRFKDYINRPKPNMYRSLHTTVVSRDGIPFEVQIRTYEMHKTAEFGVAAHWRYKSGERGNPYVDAQLAWIARLIESEENIDDPEEYMHSFKKTIFREEIFVFTPKGDIITLAQGATVIDFAYAIHTEVGNKMIGAKINGVIVPIDRTPQTGDVIEILTQSNHGPSRDWLNIVTTSEARNKIRQWFKREKRSENIEVGKEAVTRELRRLGHAFTAAETEEIILAVAQRMGMQSAEDLYNAIGYGGMTMSRIAVKLRDESTRLLKNQEERQRDAAVADAAALADFKDSKPKRLKNDGGIVVDGATGCLVKFAKCCTPLPGDPVIGFVTKGFGVSVHKRDCPNAVKGVSDPEQADRWLSAHWDMQSVSTLYEAALSVLSQDKIGALASITTALAEMKVSVLSLTTMPPKDGMAVINITVGCRDVAHYNSIVSHLRSVKTVVSVKRN